MILTEMLSSLWCQEVLSTDCVKAIENFQCTMIEKKTYLAFYLRKTISMSFDAMTTSPVEGVVQAWVGQKRLNYYILSLFCDVR